jgi:hypothetical protein
MSGHSARLVVVALASWFVTVCMTPLGARDRAEVNVPAAPVAHGEAVTADNTGFQGGKSAPPPLKGEIKDGKVPAFATRVAGPAFYDGYEVTRPHLLVSNVEITTPLDISASDPVVLRGVKVRVAGGQPWTILTRPGAGPLYVLWSDLGGSNDGARPPASALDIRSSGVVVHRSHLSGTADGISISGGDVRITETLIDGLAGFSGSHNDAIQLAATAENVTVARSKILNRMPQTSALYLMGRNVTLRSNYVAGGGWTIYGGDKNNGKGGAGASGVSVHDTIFGRDYFAKSGGFGPVTYWNDANLWDGNRFSDGTAVRPR